MNENTEILRRVNKIKDAICMSLGYDPERPPIHISDPEASKVMHQGAGTLGVWRSSKRFDDLVYRKIGGGVFYPLDDLAEFLFNRTTENGKLPLDQKNKIEKRAENKNVSSNVGAGNDKNISSNKSADDNE